jgi:hypothetical protein
MDFMTTAKTSAKSAAGVQETYLAGGWCAAE